MRFLPWILVWAASLGGAWFLGRESAPATVPTDGGGERVAAQGGAGGAASPRLEGAAGPRREAPDPGSERGAQLAAARPESDRLRSVVIPRVPVGQPLVLEGAATPEEALGRILAYASAQLAGGRDGQRELYRTLDRLLEDKTLEGLLDDRQDGPRSAYPLARFLVERDAQVADLAEEVFRSAAEDPQFFEGTGNGTLEVFTEGLGPVLPGMLSDARLDRLRGYVLAALQQPDERQPRALRSNRGELQRLLESWVPALPPAEALARLKEGKVVGREALALLRRVRPEDRGSLDLVGLLGPLFDEGDVRVLSSNLLQGLDGRTLSTLDTRLIDASARDGKSIGDWHFRTWLAATARLTWEGGRGFVEQALRMGGRTADNGALLLVQLQPRPPADAVDSLLKSYNVSARVAQSVRGAFGLR